MEAHRLDWAKGWLSKPKGNYIGGKWVHGDATTEVINPATGEALTRVMDASAKEVDAAVTAARSASGPWVALSRRQRAAALNAIAQTLRSHRAELATLEALQNGKTYREAFEDDLPESADVFDYYAGWIDKHYGEANPVEKGFLSFTQNEPLGVCALVVPWNFPLLLACWKIAPALAMGNTVLVKPSPFTPLTLVRACEILEKVLPPGVLNLVTGGAPCGEALSRHPGIDKISFTGSTAVGKRIVEASGASNLKAVTLELGGKSPNIIFDDVKDLDPVIDRSFTAMFSHKGEKCSEPTRFLLQEGIYKRFSEALAAKAEKVVCGDPFDPKTQQGPQCHRDHFEKVLSYIELGKKEGARLLAGGTRDTSGTNGRGFYIRPTIFGDASNSMRIAREEIFGPVLTLIPFKTEAEAISMANDSPYGLAAGLYSGDTHRAMRVAQALEAGMVFVNHYGCYDFASPFGGVKQSGWGREMARQSLEAYTRSKTIWVRYQ